MWWSSGLKIGSLRRGSHSSKPILDRGNRNRRLSQRRPVRARVDMDTVGSELLLNNDVSGPAARSTLFNRSQSSTEAENEPKNQHS